MALPSREIIKRAALVTITVAIVSITSSAGIRLLLGVPSDSITIIIRIVLPFLIATPVTLIWFRKLDRLENAYRLLSSHAHELARTASIDPLTGAFNRRHFIEQFDNAMELGVRGWFLIADIDYLKKINDNYGHLAGDEAVISTAKALEFALPKDSLIARIGGDEFCAFIPNIDYEDIINVNKEVNRLAEKFYRKAVLKEGAFLTVSVGQIRCDSKQTFKNVMDQADIRLYRKKSMRSE